MDKYHQGRHFFKVFCISKKAKFIIMLLLTSSTYKLGENVHIVLNTQYSTIPTFNSWVVSQTCNLLTTQYSIIPTFNSWVVSQTYNFNNVFQTLETTNRTD